MSVLTKEFFYQEGSRLTGVWLESQPAVTGSGNLAGFYFIDIPSDQHVELEATFLGPFLPFKVGGIYGNNPDGSQWIVFALVGPYYEGLYGNFGGGQLDNFLESLDRALSFNAEAEDSADRVYRHEDLIELYTNAGIDAASVDWPTNDLVNGLLAEMCGASLQEIAFGYPRKCAYPGVDHDCQLNVFLDIFASWQKRLLQGGGG